MTPSQLSTHAIEMANESGVIGNLSDAGYTTDESIDLLIDSLIVTLRTSVPATERAKIIASINLAFDELGNAR